MLRANPLVVAAAVAVACTKPPQTVEATPNSTGPRLYVTAFQTGKIFEIELDSPRVVRTFPVDDGSGTVGMVVTPSGRELIIVDGSREHRVRIVDTATGSELASKPFHNRALMLGGGPVATLSADGETLFLTTYDYGAAATGMRIFDVPGRTFQSLGLRTRPCDAPKLAHPGDHSLIAVCPDFLQELKPLLDTTDYLPSGPKVDVAIDRLDNVRLTPDGQELYLLGYAPWDEQPWWLVRWRRGETGVERIDLKQKIELARDDPRGGGVASVAISADGARLGLVQNRNIWLLERQSLKVVARTTVDTTLDGALFTPNGDLLTFDVGPAGLTLMRLSASGHFRRETLADVHLRPSGVWAVLGPGSP